MEPVGESGPLDSSAAFAPPVTEDPLDPGDAFDTPVPGSPSTPAGAFQRVLVLGDSFVGTFSHALAPRFLSRGVEFHADVWAGVTVIGFASSHRMARLLAKHSPDLVLLHLGANDVELPHPDARASTVRRIAEGLRGRTCVWILPALWKKDTGIVRVIEENAAPCVVYGSRGFHVPRLADGYHPSNEGGRIWADQFWEFFEAAKFPPVVTTSAE